VVFVSDSGAVPSCPERVGVFGGKTREEIAAQTNELFGRPGHPGAVGEQIAIIGRCQAFGQALDRSEVAQGVASRGSLEDTFKQF
jgi:hypothetical protein